MDNKILIKKYENRRLYDATHSRYVNLDEVARAVQDGFDVQVVDATSGEDITRFVMTQIIIESAKEPDSTFPLDILREMVVASRKASQESALKYMRTVAEMYKNTLRGLSHTMTPLEIMQNMINSTSGAQANAPEEATNAASDTKNEEAKDSSEIQELKQRIQELEAVVKSNKASAPAKKRARKKA